MTEKKCLRCLLREAFPADYRQYVASILGTIRPSDRASDTVYEERLARCKACDQLQNGTCMGCGCLVELRAAYARGKCPFRKWETPAR